MQQEHEVTTPLSSVRECCRRLREEWEGMIQNAETISSEAVSCFKSQEAALAVERREVQSLVQESCNLRRSCILTIEGQEKKLQAERRLADQIKLNISSQLGEVKQLQCHLSSQLANLRGSIERIKGSKQQEAAISSLAPPSTSKLCDTVLHQCVEPLPLKNKDAGLLRVLCDSSFRYTDRHNLDTDSKLFQLNDIKNDPMASQKVLKQDYSKPNSEVQRDKEYAQCTEPLKHQVGSAGSLLLLACHDGHDEHQLDEAAVKVELTEGTDSSRALKTFLQGADGSDLYFEAAKDELDNVLLSVRLDILLQRIHQGKVTNEDDGRNPYVKLLRREKLRGSVRHSVSKRTWEVPIEVALQEDAPGLLEKLQERGLLEEMTIYGAVCGDDYGNGDNDFKDLESIASKIWGTPSGLIKAPHVIRQHASGLGKDPAYCLACLVSLIDQAKSLKQRNWPVEWGWCRELQAFIFVFDKHNRVVLERPEYGNATYFFELVQFLPVKWQVLRLIRVLTVTALGKTALLENKPLEVGFELTDRESQILEGFGWARGTGLGSFLNFCDRVYHDVKEEDNLEWRQKIGKCLMDGHDKGRIVTPVLPLKLLIDMDCKNVESDIKPSVFLH